MLLISKTSKILMSNLTNLEAEEIAIGDLPGGEVVSLNCYNVKNLTKIIIGTDKLTHGIASSYPDLEIKRVSFKEGGSLDCMGGGKVLTINTEGVLVTKEVQGLVENDIIFSIYKLDNKYYSDATDVKSTPNAPVTVDTVTDSPLELTDLKSINLLGKRENLLVHVRDSENIHMGNIFIVLKLPYNGNGGVSWERLKDY